MIAIDTNIIIRFLVKDDEAQAKKVYELFSKCEKEKSNIYVSVLVLLEAIWVLESAYELTREDIIGAYKNLLLVPIFKFQNHQSIQNFIVDAENSSYDLSDLLILHSSIGKDIERLVTFDKKLSKHEFAHLLK